MNYPLLSRQSLKYLQTGLFVCVSMTTVALSHWPYAYDRDRGVVCCVCCVVLCCVVLCCVVLCCVVLCCVVVRCGVVWCGVLRCVAVCCDVVFYFSLL